MFGPADAAPHFARRHETFHPTRYVAFAESASNRGCCVSQPTFEKPTVLPTALMQAMGMIGNCTPMRSEGVTAVVTDVRDKLRPSVIRRGG